MGATVGVEMSGKGVSDGWGVGEGGSVDVIMIGAAVGVFSLCIETLQPDTRRLRVIRIVIKGFEDTL